MQNKNVTVFWKVLPWNCSCLLCVTVICEIKRHIDVFLPLFFSSVADLKHAIQAKYKIAIQHQVLVVNGGECMAPDRRVCSYSAGTVSARCIHNLNCPLYIGRKKIFYRGIFKYFFLQFAGFLIKTFFKCVQLINVERTVNMLLIWWNNWWLNIVLPLLNSWIYFLSECRTPTQFSYSTKKWFCVSVHQPSPKPHFQQRMRWNWK